MGKFLLFLLAILILIPRLMRMLVPRRRPPDEPPRREGGPAREDERLRDLTRQDISDADYEEIPPED